MHWFQYWLIHNKIRTILSETCRAGVERTGELNERVALKKMPNIKNQKISIINFLMYNTYIHLFVQPNGLSILLCAQ